MNDLLLHFMAHAPAEPQPWFIPTLPPKPEIPRKPQDLTDDEQAELDLWSEGDIEAKDMKHTRAGEYAMAREIWRKESEAYKLLEVKEKYVQWPKAWALAVIATI